MRRLPLLPPICIVDVDHERARPSFNLDFSAFDLNRPLDASLSSSSQNSLSVGSSLRKQAPARALD